MATVKITQITKDFARKTKDVLDVLKECGIDKKSGATLSEAEFSAFVCALSLANQIENLDDYLSGKARILTDEAKEREEAARIMEELKSLKEQLGNTEQSSADSAEKDAPAENE